MTAQNIFDTALILMFGEEADRSDYQPFFISILNALLGENFAQNNALRAIRGKEPLDSIPLISNMSDVVPYEDEYTRTILPYGVAGYIYSDDDRNMGAEYKNKYEYERSKIITSAYEEVDDVYKLWQ